MLLLLPIFLVLLLGFLELSLIVIVEERLAAASGQGARAASQGGTVADIQAAVTASLGSGNLQANTVLTVMDPNGLTTSPELDAAGVPLTVTLTASAGTVIPDLLRFIGFSIANQPLIGQTVMRKE
jgi:Flp pilus assembly protein TadG